MNESATKESYFWADAMRVVATFTVVMIHVADPVAKKLAATNNHEWLTALFFDSFRFCVPFFLMISGALLLGKPDSLPDFFRKRMSRILPPFLLWSLVYIIHKLISQMKQTPVDAGDIAAFVWSNIQNPAYYHLWFMYVLIGLYLFYPILSRFARHAKNSELLYFLGIWFALQFFEFPVFREVLPAFELRYFTGAIGYPVLGYYLARNDFGVKSRLYGGLLFVSSLVFTFLISWHYSTNGITRAVDETFFMINTPNVVLMSTGLFLWIREYKPTNLKVIEYASRFGKYSYGIYLAHVFILMKLHSNGLRGSLIHPAIGVPMVTVICFAMTFGLIWLLHRVPFLKKIAG
ncbi:MAG: hypothetical protein EOO50_16025 [Flavobacterium sp.]|uniref:acyltransferase n=1 Tax=Flavobacterium sp. TaxID=239 RepID=UPI00121D49A8|nr:acyltransferase family protein [Flavobacterium sp.]RZJ64307.1 MAG: hypothetical protein EOO50_16025 [Flavobacterium sp.]